MKTNEFFSRHMVFCIEELDRFLENRTKNVTKSRKNILEFHRRKGRIVKLRRGLYATVPAGFDPAKYPVDPYLVASKMTGDAVLAYHSALEIHGYAHSVFNQFYFLSEKRVKPFRLQSYEIRSVTIPSRLVAKSKSFYGVEERDRMEDKIKVTNIERTLVDVLDRPDLSGGWEEIWKSLEPLAYLGTDKILEYLLLLENATTTAKVGFFLETHQESLMVDDVFLCALEELRPKEPHYLSRRNRGNAGLAKRWNLLVPKEILNRSWEEPQ